MARPVSKQLFELISKLETSERSYVRKALLRPLNKRPGAMLDLFDIMCKASSATDPAISDFLKKYGSATAASQLKKYLYESILRNLRSLEATKSSRSTTLAMLEDVTLLQDRAMAVLAFDRATQALELAEKGLYHILEAEILQSLVILEKRITSNDTSDAIMQTLQRQEVALENALKLNRLTMLSRELRLLQLNIGSHVDKRVVDILANELLADNTTYSSARCQMWYHHSRSYAFHLLDDNAKVVYEIDKLLLLLQQYPMLEDETYFIVLVANKAAAQIELRDVKGLDKSVSLLKSLSPKTASVKEELDANVLWTECSLLLLKQGYREILSIADRILEDTSTSLATIAYMHLMKAVAFQHVDKYSDSIKSIYDAMSTDVDDKEFRIACKVVEVVVHLYLGNRDIIEYKLRSMQRSLPRDILKGFMWKAFTKAMRLGSKDTSDPKAVLRGMAAEMESIHLSRGERSIVRLAGLYR